jgi:hypothetical protein
LSIVRKLDTASPFDLVDAAIDTWMSAFASFGGDLGEPANGEPGNVYYGSDAENTDYGQDIYNPGP